jgi:predicted RNase H-like nuclease
VDPHSPADRRAIEVYPHPATIALFGLDRTIKYKHEPGRDLGFLRSELLRLMTHLESLQDADPPLLVRGCADWRQLRTSVSMATQKSRLKRAEDVVDAVLCGYIALLAGRCPERTIVYGDTATGYILTPALVAE